MNSKKQQQIKGAKKTMKISEANIKAKHEIFIQAVFECLYNLFQRSLNQYNMF